MISIEVDQFFTSNKRAIFGDLIIFGKKTDCSCIYARINDEESQTVL